MTQVAASAELKKTALHALHVEAGAKMVPFAGYSMPLHYEKGIVHEHVHTRKQAGLFDVSHMGQVRLIGNDPAAAIEKLVPASIRDLKPGHGCCTVLLNERGGIIDDMIISRPPPGETDNPAGELSIVFNASRKEIDCEYIERHLADDCHLKKLDDKSLLALQGPSASAVMGRLLGDEVTTQPFMSQCLLELEGDWVTVSRCGYTGEDGYEISIPSDRATALTKRLLSENEVELTGIGARDSLRMEAGLCLYGSDIDETTTPVEANLVWMISKERCEQGEFPGAAIILEQLNTGTQRQRIGIRPEGRVIARGGAEINAGGTAVGKVTSGCFGPTVQGPVAIGYVSTQYTSEGTELELNVRGKGRRAQVATLPFVPTQYYKKTKS